VWSEPCNVTRKVGSAYTIAFSPDGQLLAAATGEVVKVWDWKKNQVLYSLAGQNFFTIPVAFSGNGRLATGTRKGVQLWDAETGIPLFLTAPEDLGIYSAIAFSGDGKWLASANYGKTVKLSNSMTGELLRTLLHPGNQVECIAISPDGRRLASGG